MLPFGRAGLGAGTYCTEVLFVEDGDDDDGGGIDEEEEEEPLAVPEEEELSLAGCTGLLDAVALR